MVFLTTLSVYLGLALVGATPPVLAQTSENEKNFQISFNQDVYGSAIYTLVNELEKLAEQRKYSWSEKIDLTYQFSPFEVDTPSAFTVSALSGKTQSKIVSYLFNNTAEKISRNLSELENSFSNKDDKYLSPFAISFSLDDLGLTIKTNRSVTDGFSNYLLNRFEQEAATRKNHLVGKIYESTKISSENNQVFIVTRLPRASIDVLLAEKVAK
jgi:hypothetical protein